MWFRLDVEIYRDSRVRVGRCAAVWPWLLAQLKVHGGSCAELDIDAGMCAEDLRIPPNIAEDQIEGAKRVGLLVRGSDERWRTPNWDRYQPDARAKSSQRRTEQETSNVIESQGPDGTIHHRPVLSQGRTGTNKDNYQNRTPLHEGEYLIKSRAGACDPPREAGASNVRGQGPSDCVNYTVGDSGPKRVVDGVERYQFWAVREMFQARWPTYDWNTRKMTEFVREVIEEAPAAVIDQAVGSTGYERLTAPWGVKKLCQALMGRQRKQSRVSMSSAEDIRAQAFLALRSDPARLDLVIDQMISANEPPPTDEMRELIHQRLAALGRPVPPLFR